MELDVDMLKQALTELMVSQGRRMGEHAVAICRVIDLDCGRFDTKEAMEFHRDAAFKAHQNEVEKLERTMEAYKLLAQCDRAVAIEKEG